MGALARLRKDTKGSEYNGKRKCFLREEMSSIFRKKTKNTEFKKRPVWKHKFFCLSDKNQVKVPTSETEKEELYQSGLGEKEIQFDSMELDAQNFKHIIYSNFPRLSEGGGFHLLKCLPNTRKLELLPQTVYSSPASLKQRVGSSRTYIRPIQRNLELNFTDESNDWVS